MGENKPEVRPWGGNTYISRFSRYLMTQEKHLQNLSQDGVNLFRHSRQNFVNLSFTGGSTTGSLVRASFSSDGRFVVSGSAKGQVRVWDAQGGKRVRTPLQTLGMPCCLRDFAWHPHQHVLALAGYGPDSPVLLYYGDAIAGKKTEVVESRSTHQSSLTIEENAWEVQASAEEHRRSLENRQRLGEMRIKRLRAKALGSMEGSFLFGSGSHTDRGVAAALVALTAGGSNMKASRRESGPGTGNLSVATATSEPVVVPPAITEPTAASWSEESRLHYRQSVR